MTSHDACRVVHQYIDAVNAHDLAAVARVADDRLALAVKWLTDGNPDLRFELEWMVSDGDKVTAWIYGSGTHSGVWTYPPSAGPMAYQLLPPTGRSWRAACSATYRVDGGRIVDFSSGTGSPCSIRSAPSLLNRRHSRSHLRAVVCPA